MDMWYPNVPNQPSIKFKCKHAQTLDFYMLRGADGVYICDQVGPLYDMCRPYKAWPKHASLKNIKCKLPPTPKGVITNSEVYIADDVAYLSKKFAQTKSDQVKAAEIIFGFEITRDSTKEFIVDVNNGMAQGKYFPELYGANCESYVVPVRGAKKNGLYIVHYGDNTELVVCDKSFTRQFADTSFNVIVDRQEDLIPYRGEDYTCNMLVDSDIARVILAGGEGHITIVVPQFEAPMKFVDDSGNISDIYRNPYLRLEQQCSYVEVTSLLCLAYNKFIGVTIPEVKIPQMFWCSWNLNIDTGDDLVNNALDTGMLLAYEYQNQVLMLKPNKLNPAYMNYTKEEIEYIFKFMEEFNSKARRLMKKLLR